MNSDAGELNGTRNDDVPSGARAITSDNSAPTWATGSGGARVLLVEHQPLIADALDLLLKSEPEIEVVAAVASAEDALNVCRRSPPDVVILDIDLPDMDGVKAARQVRGICPDSKVVVITALDRTEVMASAVEAGAVGFVAKTQTAEELMAAIKRAADGEMVIAPAEAGPVLGRLQEVVRPSSGAGERLTPRETEVLQALANGQSTQEVAQSLFVSPRTVQNQVNGILAKLGVRSKLEAVLVALREGVVHLPSST